MAAVTLGQQVQWGILADEAGLITQSMTVNYKIDMKEIKNRQGEVVTVTTYNKTADVSVEGYGLLAEAIRVGEQLTLANTLSPALAECTVITEATVTLSNEDHAKTSFKAMNYPNVILTPGEAA